MKILSFIIPAYNSEPFLAKCIESMLAEELLDKIEVIVVNDGSSDKTEQIALDYADRYPNTVFLITQENKGHGGALNAGCKKATGKYLKAIDADDWVQTESLPGLVHELEQCEAEVVLTNYRTINITTGEKVNWRCFPPQFGRGYTFAQIMQSWRSFDRGLTFHGIIYRTDFYQEKAKPLPEHLFYEDHVFATYPACYAQQVCVLDLFVYEYRIGDVNQSVSAQNQLKRLNQTMAVVQNMVEQYKEIPDTAGKKYAAMKTRSLAMSYMSTALLVDPDKRNGRYNARTLQNYLQSEVPEILQMMHSHLKVFYAMNRLHLDKNVLNWVLHSKIYNKMRGNHSFD